MSQTKKFDKWNTFIGKKINYLTITGVTVRNNYTMFECICDCGNIRYKRPSVVIGEYNKSCGCKTESINRTRIHKYTYNLDFFKTLTPQSAYVLGFIYSDGCIAEATNGRLRGFNISLKQSDDYILSKIGSLLGCDRVYRKENNSSSLNIDKQEIAEDLISWGLHPRKSFDLKVDERLEYNKDFWRGMIDGDGSVSMYLINGFSRASFGLCGTLEVCESFKKFCNSFGLGLGVNVSIVKKYTNFATYTLTGGEAIGIGDIIYEGKEDLFLIRKYEKYMKMKDVIGRSKRVRGYRKIKCLNLV